MASTTELEQMVADMRRLGVTEMKWGDRHLVLAPESPKDLPAPAAPVMEEVNKDTGLTPSEEKLWFDPLG